MLFHSICRLRTCSRIGSLQERVSEIHRFECSGTTCSNAGWATPRRTRLKRLKANSVFTGTHGIWRSGVGVGNGSLLPRNTIDLHLARTCHALNTMCFEHLRHLATSGCMEENGIMMKVGEAYTVVDEAGGHGDQKGKHFFGCGCSISQFYEEGEHFIYCQLLLSWCAPGCVSKIRPLGTRVFANFAFRGVLFWLTNLCFLKDAVLEKLNKQIADSEEGAGKKGGLMVSCVQARLVLGCWWWWQTFWRCLYGSLASNQLPWFSDNPVVVARQ